MKKITLLFSAVLIFTLSFYSCEQSQLDPTDSEGSDFGEIELMYQIDSPQYVDPCGEQICTLWAGQHYDAGNVTVSNDASNLFITIEVNERFEDSVDDNGNPEENLYIWIETELPDRRPNPGEGNSAGSLDPYLKIRIDPNEQNPIRVYTIPYSQLGIATGVGEECVPQQFYVMVHANVMAWTEDGDGNDVLTGETAWGGCSDEQTGQGGWWYYTDYYTQCCECWCGFGNNYQNTNSIEKEKACKSGVFEGQEYIFWSNKHDLETIKDSGVNGYRLSLLATPSLCVPQFADGEFVEGHQATEVGEVVLMAIAGDDENIKVIYTLEEDYRGYNIQLDLYIGADRVPPYTMGGNGVEMGIIQDDLHRLYQIKLTPGVITHTFTVPWLTLDGSTDTFIALHAAIGDCPMPSLQEPYKP